MQDVEKAKIKIEVYALLHAINKATAIMGLERVDATDQEWRIVIENLVSLEEIIKADLRHFSYEKREIMREGRKAARKLWKEYMILDLDSQGLYGWIPLKPSVVPIITPGMRLYQLLKGD